MRPSGKHRARAATLRMCALSLALLIAGPGFAAAGPPNGSGSSQTAPPTSPKKPSSKSKKKKRRARNRGQQVPTPERIREIQEALGRSGYLSGDPTGKWDSATIEGMKKFQAANGIEPTGKLDARSLQKLGLGSDVAGLSAPRPTPPPAASITPIPPPTKPDATVPPQHE